MADKLQGGVLAGSVDLSTAIVLRKTADSTEQTGKLAADMTLSYWRQGGVRVAVTASDLAAVNSAHSDGGVKEVDATNMPGAYRVDWPDAAFATGADWVVLTVKVASTYVFHERYSLTTNVIQTGDSFARLGAAGAGLTAVPWNAAWDAEVESEVNDALVVHRLDELLNADSDIDGLAPPVVGSVFHELMSKTAGSFSFDQTTDSLEALRDRGDAAWITATGFSTHTAADVWISATRTLTAATNLSALAQASVCTEARLAELDFANLPTDAANIKAKTDLLPEGPAKNTAFTYVIKMVDSSDDPVTGLTITMTRSLDGAAFAVATGTVTEISTGHYKVAASAADMNGDVVAHRFAATGAKDLTMEFITTA